MFNGIGKVTKLDEIFLSIMSYDIHKVIEKCSESLPTWWFAAHLTDLLFHAGLLKSFHLELVSFHIRKQESVAIYGRPRVIVLR